MSKFKDILGGASKLLTRKKKDKKMDLDGNNSPFVTYGRKDYDIFEGVVSYPRETLPVNKATIFNEDIAGAYKEELSFLNDIENEMERYVVPEKIKVDIDKELEDLRVVEASLELDFDSMFDSYEDKGDTNTEFDTIFDDKEKVSPEENLTYEVEIEVPEIELELENLDEETEEDLEELFLSEEKLKKESILGGIKGLFVKEKSSEEQEQEEIFLEQEEISLEEEEIFLEQDEISLEEEEIFLEEEEISLEEQEQPPIEEELFFEEEEPKKKGIFGNLFKSKAENINLDAYTPLEEETTLKEEKPDIEEELFFEDNKKKEKKGVFGLFGKKSKPNTDFLDLEDPIENEYKEVNESRTEEVYEEDEDLSPEMLELLNSDTYSSDTSGLVNKNESIDSGVEK